MVNSRADALIVELYKDFSPPYPLIPRLRKALEVVPPRYLIGLDRIVLTNFEALPRNKRRGVLASTKSAYWQAWKDEPAYIEILVDKHLQDSPGNTFPLRHRCISRIAMTMFGEIGHHIIDTKIAVQGVERKDASEYMTEFTIDLGKRQWYYQVAALACFAVYPSFLRSMWQFYRDPAKALSSGKKDQRKLAQNAKAESKRHRMKTKKRG
ncbi:MAG: hypothetical protein AMXMBFR84_33790 [Candidatus Hydrogenedentota bacterium]